MAMQRTLTPLEPWPRLVDWLDAVVPFDFDRQGRFAHSMRVEEFTRDGDFVVRAELPGFDPDKDIEISIADGCLTIEANREERSESDRRSEFHYGRFVRSLTLPPGVNEQSVSATYEDGILEVAITMPPEPTEPTEATRVPVKRAP